MFMKTTHTATPQPPPPTIPITTACITVVLRRLKPLPLRRTRPRLYPSSSARHHLRSRTRLSTPPPRASPPASSSPSTRVAVLLNNRQPPEASDQHRRTALKPSSDPPLRRQPSLRPPELRFQLAVDTTAPPSDLPVDLLLELRPLSPPLRPHASDPDADRHRFSPPAHTKIPSCLSHRLASLTSRRAALCSSLAADHHTSTPLPAEISRLQSRSDPKLRPTRRVLPSAFAVPPAPSPTQRLTSSVTIQQPLFVVAVVVLQ